MTKPNPIDVSEHFAAGLIQATYPFKLGIYEQHEDGEFERVCDAQAVGRDADGELLITCPGYDEPVSKFNIDTIKAALAAEG